MAGPRIFIGPVETAGYFAHLRRGLDALGIETTFLDLNDHRFQYGGVDTSALSRLHTRALRARWQTSRHRLLRRLFWIAMVHATRWILFATIALRHDVFVFGGASFFPSHRDLPLLKLLGKRVLFVFLGSDSRPIYLNGRYIAEGPLDFPKLMERTRQTKARLRVVERFADAVVSNPNSSQLHERPFVPFTYVGFPAEADTVPDTFPDTVPQIEKDRSDKVVVLHAPSQVMGKGTAGIRRAIGRLQAHGYPIDFRELQGRPNAEVHRALASCDFVVDQLYTDSPMGGFAREAALYGKPAVVGTYAAAEFDRECREGRLPPCRWTLPEDIEGAIAELASNPARRAGLGSRAKQYVTTAWSAEAVAGRFLDMTRGRPVPLIDPRTIRYTGGYGMPRARLAEVIGGIVQAAGKEALLLGDKPQLEHALLEIASREHDAESAPRSIAV